MLEGSTESKDAYEQVFHLVPQLRCPSLHGRMSRKTQRTSGPSWSSTLEVGPGPMPLGPEVVEPPRADRSHGAPQGRTLQGRGRWRKHSLEKLQFHRSSASEGEEGYR